GSGTVRTSDYRLFRPEERDPNVEAWIVTTLSGLKNLGDAGSTPVFAWGVSNRVDLGAMLRALRKDHGIRYLLCEGGPTLYGNMVRGGWMDEKFLTIAPQEIGMLASGEGSQSSQARAQRLTVLAAEGFTVETAPWYHWISCRRAGDHEFNRYRART